MTLQGHLDSHAIRWLAADATITDRAFFVEPLNAIMNRTGYFFMRAVRDDEIGQTIGAVQRSPGLDDGEAVLLYGFAEVDPLPPPRDARMFVRWFNSRKLPWAKDALPLGWRPLLRGEVLQPLDVRIGDGDEEPEIATVATIADMTSVGPHVRFAFGTFCVNGGRTGWIRSEDPEERPPVDSRSLIRWLRARGPWTYSFPPVPDGWVRRIKPPVVPFQDIMVAPSGSVRLALPGLDDAWRPGIRSAGETFDLCFQRRVALDPFAEAKARMANIEL